MRIWVTRPADDADAVAEALRQRGHEPVVAPLFEVRPRPFANPFEAGFGNGTFDAIVATSRNALQIFAASLDAAAIGARVITVGPGTAQAARELGYGNVVEGPGRASGIPDLLRQAGDASAGLRLLYLRGADVAVDLATALVDAGYEVSSIVLYDMVETEAPDAALSAKLVAGDIDAVMLFSPRASQHYAARMRARGLGFAAAGLRHYCLSDRVAAGLEPLEPCSTLVARHANIEEMLELAGR